MMKFLKIRTYTAIVVSSVCGSAIAADELSAPEVSQLFSGNTVEAYSELSQSPVSLFYDKNGEVRGVFSNGKKGSTEWWVEENGQICLKGKSGNMCFVVVEDGGEYRKLLIKENGERVLAFSMEVFTTGNVNKY